MSEFIPHTITECVRELSKLVPGAEIGFISATSRVTWLRPSQHDDENNWNEMFIVCVGDRLKVSEKTLLEAYKAARDYIWTAYG